MTKVRDFTETIWKRWSSSLKPITRKERLPFLMSATGSSNIFWHECPVGKVERQKLLNQQGCVVWITGLSGSGVLFSTRRHPNWLGDDDEDDKDEENGEDQVDSDDDEAAADGDEALT
ncbi:hypothetical protein POM88_035938 [Heracleum sosnowskyi]|uniref:Uncharacterized protein n=1 Tax=Heracleum sosnowskyi TaxID=360622 RepID=A0AAD8HMG4_9APIA|nr:hypothetical protein POM88_035938 [Heracleum sosnowskyi]